MPELTDREYHMVRKPPGFGWGAFLKSKNGRMSTAGYQEKNGVFRLENDYCRIDSRTV